MKHALKNPATHFAMLLMALAMAFAFLACEEKKKPEAEQPDNDLEASRGEYIQPVVKSEAIPAEEAGEDGRCPNEIGPLQTAEATFLGTEEDDHEGLASVAFLLANGEKISLNGNADSIKKGDKVSITYKQIGADFGDGCVPIDVLKSVKILPK